MKRVLPFALLALAACGAPVSETLTTARHVPSNVPYGTGGARLHLFVFDPSEPRPLADRKAIARRQIALEPSCAWVGGTRYLPHRGNPQTGRTLRRHDARRPPQVLKNLILPLGPNTSGVRGQSPRRRARQRKDPPHGKL